MGYLCGMKIKQNVMNMETKNNQILRGLAIQLTKLEQMVKQGTMTCLSATKRAQIEAKLCDAYDMDDLVLLYGTPHGVRLMELRRTLANRKVA